MKIVTVAAFAALTLASTRAAATDYTVLITGRPSGAMSINEQNGERTVAFIYNDRGRGENLKEKFRFNSRGFIQNLSITGSNYWSVPVDERFSIDNGRAKWVSEADSGEGSAEAFYRAFTGSQEHSAALIRAALKLPNRTVSLLPSGSATVHPLFEHVMKGPNGAEERLTLYFIDGLEMTALPIWLDAKGELFFAGST